MNLLCAQGLDRPEDSNLGGALAMLDQMAERVRAETDRHFHRFRQNPAEFDNSEGFFRMIMLAVVLAEDFEVHYAPNKIGSAAEARMGDGFYSDAKDVFLEGLLGAKREGTCSSLPVLQVAVGRRLGYPLKLVTTKGHLFVRWENSQERFNIEAAGRGVNRFADEYYRHWPLEVSAEEVVAEGYLKSLAPAEELAVFMSVRGMCLFEARRYAAADLTPKSWT
ncbi:MAG TPA: transglutaminase family protein [Candidatus Angelobacter sp.]|nr:transglutaminase family protein [Candidatus Angelobacter sp.]